MPHLFIFSHAKCAIKIPKKFTFQIQNSHSKIRLKTTDIWFVGYSDVSDNQTKIHRCISPVFKNVSFLHAHQSKDVETCLFRRQIKCQKFRIV